jgi:hypothetical protein
MSDLPTGDITGPAIFAMLGVTFIALLFFRRSARGPRRGRY